MMIGEELAYLHMKMTLCVDFIVFGPYRWHDTHRFKQSYTSWFIKSSWRRLLEVELVLRIIN